MFSVTRPTDGEVRAYLALHRDLPFSYDGVGCTREELVARPGWNVDHERVELGRGESVFERARRAIDRWQMFPSAVTTVHWPEPPREALAVAVLYRAWPLWLLFPARVVYTLREPTTLGGNTIERYGFAYGTLPDHPERGEERFLVEWNRIDDRVWYDLLAVSQPAHWLARLGTGYARYEQSRFRRLSGLAMQHAVSQTEPLIPLIPPGRR